MVIKSKLIRKCWTTGIVRMWEVSEMENPDSCVLIGYVFEYPYGFEWEHNATENRSISSFKSKSGAMRRLKLAHLRMTNKAANKPLTKK